MVKRSLATWYFPFLNCLWHGYCWMLWNVNNAKVVNSAFPAPWQRWWMETSVQGLSDSLPSHSSCFEHSAGPNVLQSPANPLLNFSMSAPHKMEENLEGKVSDDFFSLSGYFSASHSDSWCSHASLRQGTDLSSCSWHSPAVLVHASLALHSQITHLPNA